MGELVIPGQHQPSLATSTAGVSIEGLAGIHWKTLRGRDEDSLVDHLGGGV